MIFFHFMFVFIFAIPTSIQRCPIPSLFLAYAYEKPRKGCFRTTSSVVDVCGRGWRGTLCCRRGFGLYSLKKESCNDRRSSCFRGRLDSKHLGRNSLFYISLFLEFHIQVQNTMSKLSHSGIVHCYFHLGLYPGAFRKRGNDRYISEDFCKFCPMCSCEPSSNILPCNGGGFWTVLIYFAAPSIDGQTDF